MFIYYAGTNVHAMCRTNKAATTLNQSPQEVRSLQPGWNEFPKDIWDQNKDNPSIKKMIADKTIVLMKEEVKVQMRDKKSGKVKTMKKVVGQDDRPIRVRHFDEKKAIDIVGKTWNRDILQRWLDEENRHKVKRALEKQIKPLLSPEKDDSDDAAFDEDGEEW